MRQLSTVIITLSNPFPTEHLPELYHWVNNPRSANYDDFGPLTYSQFDTDIRSRIQHEITWAVFHESRVIGYVGAQALNPICYSLKGLVIDPEERGKGFGTDALRMALGLLRSKFGAKKILSTVFRDNRAIGLMLRREAGAVEGILHDATEREGKPLDLVIWGL